MSVRVAHIVQSVVAEPGSVAVCLPGLAAALNPLGFLSSLNADTHDADVVHVHGWGYGEAIWAARDSIRAGQPLVLSPLGALGMDAARRKSLLERLRFAWSERRLIRAARATLGVNELEARELGENHAVSGVRVLGYGIRCASYERRASDGGRRLVFLGSFHPSGGSVALLKAVAEIGPVADGWTVELAGANEGEWRPALEAAVRRKGGEQRVRFVSAHDEASQAELLRSASLVVGPSFRSDAGVSVLQASAAGVASIATSVAVPDALKSAVTVCEPTRESLREALRSVMGLTDQERTRLGERAKAACVTACDWSVVAPQYADLYRRVARD